MMHELFLSQTKCSWDPFYSFAILTPSLEICRITRLTLISTESPSHFLGQWNPNPSRHAFFPVGMQLYKSLIRLTILQFSRLLTASRKHNLRSSCKQASRRSSRAFCCFLMAWVKSFIPAMGLSGPERIIFLKKYRLICQPIEKRKLDGVDFVNIWSVRQRWPLAASLSTGRDCKGIFKDQQYCYHKTVFNFKRALLKLIGWGMECVQQQGLSSSTS